MTLTLGEQSLKSRLMLGRHGEVNCRLLAIASIQRRLHEVLLDGLARPLLVGVECHQALGLCTISEAVDYDVANNLLILDLGFEILRQLGEEGELLEIYDELVDACRALVVIDILEQLLEHACRGTRCGHELHHA